MSSNLRIALLIIEAATLVVGAMQSAVAHAQVEEEHDRTAATLENGLIEAGLYAIHPPGDAETRIKLHEQSLLKWNNSVNQSVFGNIFVWTRAGRPEVIASIYQFYSPKTEFAAEFQSLSLGPLVIEKSGKEIWTPKQAGIVLKAFEEVAEPPPSKAQRLVEMRRLAGLFTVELTDWSHETYRLRLLPKPLLRYGVSDTELLDGALFAYTYTTDPELLVLVEARKSDSGFRWMYGLARMNIGELKVSYRDHEIWKAERLEHPYLYKDAVYTLFMGLPLPKR